MRTEVLKVDRQRGDGNDQNQAPEAQSLPRDALRRVVEVLSRGGLVAFPTETVYGVAACVNKPEAMDRLRDLKSRTADKAFTIHIGSREDALAFAPNLSGLARRFMRKAWPGPLTLVVSVQDPASAPVMTRLNGSALSAMYYHNTVGLRYPDDPVAEAMLRAVDVPVVAASANKSGHAPPWTAEDVLKHFDGRIDVLVDAGRTKYSKPSTIVRVTDTAYEVVREGVYDAGIVERLSVLRLLFVCTGNTCRSPMAEGLVKKLLAERLGTDTAELPERGVVVMSAGTAGGFGPASEYAVQVMADRGADVSQHQSAHLSAEMIRQADHVFVMTRMHRDRVLEMVPSAEDRVKLLVDNEEVRDPIGGDKDEYEQCAQMIERGVRARLEEVTL